MYSELLWLACTVVACVAGTLAMYSRRQTQRPSDLRLALDGQVLSTQTVALDQKWRSSVWTELVGMPPADDPPLGAEGWLLARAIVGGGEAPPERVLLQAGAGLPAALLRAVAERRWPGAERVAVPYWWEADGDYDAMVVAIRSFIPQVHNWQEEADHLALHAYRHLRPGGTVWFAVTSMVDLKLLVAQLQRNGYVVDVLAQQLFRWAEERYQDFDYITVANHLQSYMHDEKHRRLEQVSVVRATLRRPLRRLTTNPTAAPAAPASPPASGPDRT
jgi:hypothetical protein